MEKLQHHHSYPTYPIIDLSSLPGEMALLIILAFAGVPSFRLFTHIIKSNYSSLYTVSYSVNISPGMQLCPFSLSTMLEYRFYSRFFLFYCITTSYIYLLHHIICLNAPSNLSSFVQCFHLSQFWVIIYTLHIRP